MEELKQLRKKLESESDFNGVQAVNQAMIRIENLTYDNELYKKALKL
jgi:hypothetical protein